MKTLKFVSFAVLLMTSTQALAAEEHLHCDAYVGAGVRAPEQDQTLLFRTKDGLENVEVGGKIVLVSTQSGQKIRGKVNASKNAEVAAYATFGKSSAEVVFFKDGEIYCSFLAR